MEPIVMSCLLVAGIIGIAILLFATTALLARTNDPKERRSRSHTRDNADAIGRAYRAGALTMPQAVMRLREIEAPADAIKRVLA